MAAMSLEVSGLTAGYRDARVLEDVSFSVAAGERLVVLGRNGMGKTTLVSTLAGLTRRFAGQVSLGGRDITALATSQRALSGLGYVPQTRDMFRSLTVEENLRVGLKDRPRTALEEAYALFPALHGRRRTLAGQLSGGEQQMLSTARTLLGQPAVLMLDEPLEGLAPVICDELMAALTKLAETGSVTIVLVEQQLERALEFAERVIILERGRIAWSGPADAVQADRGIIEQLLGVAKVH